METNLIVVFKGGKGRITACVFRNGQQIITKSISNSGNLFLGQTYSGDAISVEGVSPSSGTKVQIDVETSPNTPKNYNPGPIIDSFDIL